MNSFIIGHKCGEYSRGLHCLEIKKNSSAKFVYLQGLSGILPALEIARARKFSGGGMFCGGILRMRELR